MRRPRQQIQSKAGAAVLVMVVFLILGGRCCGGEGPDEVEKLQGAGKAQWQQSIVQGTIAFLSPAWGQVWRQQDLSAAYPTGAVKSQGEAPYLQTLLWEEQRRAVWLVPGEQQGTLTEGQVNVQNGMPEDLAEQMQVIAERDADLLAEIDRENEAMRQQAELLQAQQNQQMLQEQQAQQDQQAQPGQGAAGIQALTLPYTPEQLGSLDFLKKNLYNVNRGTVVSEDLLDSKQLLAMDMAWESPDSGGPKVLIHHTHATEYFADSNEKEEETLIVGVGAYLKELLESRYGIQVIHDRTVYPYNEAYSQALKNVESILAENPTIEVFIDLHRDAGGTKKYTVNVEGKEMAHLMFFNGLSHTTNGPIDYLPNEHQKANLAFSFQMKMAGDSLYPGLCKRNYLKAYRYNLHVLPRAVIVEVGDHNNTLQEAKNAMEPLAHILNLILKGENS